MKALIGIIMATTCLSVAMVKGQETINLYVGEIPNSRPSAVQEESSTPSGGVYRVWGVTEPSLTVYFPPTGTKKSNKAMIICPGGGYGMLAIQHEGHDIARQLADHGITALVLKYRLPNDETMIDKKTGPLQDALRAMQLVKENAKAWGVKQVGIAGFSAGGHLASTLSTQYDQRLIANEELHSLRPDFSLLVYPVISFDTQITHMGSRNNLLGENPDQTLTAAYSSELQVGANTPPAFLVHAKDDKVVPIENAQRYAAALDKHGIANSLFVYDSGGHGFGLHNKTSKDPWLEHFLLWLENF